MKLTWPEPLIRLPLSHHLCSKGNCVLKQLPAVRQPPPDHIHFCFSDELLLLQQCKWHEVDSYDLHGFFSLTCINLGEVWSSTSCQKTSIFPPHPYFAQVETKAQQFTVILYNALGYYHGIYWIYRVVSAILMQVQNYGPQVALCGSTGALCETA